MAVDRSRLRARWFALLGICVVLLLCAASASADSGTSPDPVIGQQSLLASSPSNAQIDQALKRLTGLDASQLTTADLCPKPANPGVPQCAAQAVVARSGHQIIHLSAGPQQRPEEMSPAGTPDISAPVTGQGWPQPFTPGYLQEAYDLSWLSANKGAGDTVAIIDYGYDADAASDLTTFRSHYGLSSCSASPCFEQVNEYGSGLVANMPAAAASDWQAETSLDLDAVSSICPNCDILLVEEGSAPPDNSADDDASAEQTADTLGADQISNSWTESWSSPSSTFTFPGVLTVASAGDAGYTGATGDNYPAALPGVVAVGGTTLAQSGVAAGRGFGESAWNETPNGTGSGCDTDETKPAYQTDVGCTGRAYNDISADADPLTGLDIVNAGAWAQFGGTSLSAPLVAAYAALIGEHTDSPAWIYDPSFASDLFDPAAGNNEDDFGCAAAISYICNAGLSYDGPTGNGSISGTVVAGAPGIGGASGVVSASGTSASVVTGVYPNRLDTSYYWQYGQTTSYGQQTTPVDIGAGQGVVAISDTLTGLTGTGVDFRLVATNSDGTVYGYNTSASVSPAGATAPASASVPQIAGTAVTGQTLSTSTGTWNPAPGSLSYQWQLSTDDSTWTNIAGAAGPQYTVPVADPGDYLRVQVTATDTIGSTTASSAATAQVTTLVPWSSGVPQVSGTPLNGQTLSASTGQWAPAASEGYAYQWQRSADGSSWTNITGQTAGTYTLIGADIADTIRVQVTAFDSHGGGVPASSQPTAAVRGDTSPPTVTGTAQRLDTLTATNGQWTFTPVSYSYQWQVSSGGAWANLPSATAQTYVLGIDDEGDHVRVQVTAIGTVLSATADSAATTAVAAALPSASGTPQIDGDAQVGQVLSAVGTSWATTPDTTYGWQWYVCNSSGSGCSAAPDTGEVFDVSAADAGDDIVVAQVANNADTIAAGPVAANSAAFGPIDPAVVDASPMPPPAPVPPTPAGLPPNSTPAAPATAKITETGIKPVRTSGGEQFATARLTAVKHSKKRKLVITRAAGITVPMTGWACQTAGKKKCLSKKTSTNSASWTTTLSGALKITATLA